MRIYPRKRLAVINTPLETSSPWRTCYLYRFTKCRRISRDRLITIKGAHFIPSTTITVGNLSCTPVNLVSSEEITCTLPAGQGYNSYPVVASNNNGARPSNSNVLYKYQPPPQITSCYCSIWNTAMNITGNNFILPGLTIQQISYAVYPTPFYYQTNGSVIVFLTSIRFSVGDNYTITATNPDGQVSSVFTCIINQW